jgi:hypothetical protein
MTVRFTHDYYSTKQTTLPNPHEYKGPGKFAHAHLVPQLAGLRVVGLPAVGLRVVGLRVVGLRVVGLHML